MAHLEGYCSSAGLASRSRRSGITQSVNHASRQIRESSVVTAQSGALDAACPPPKIATWSFGSELRAPPREAKRGGEERLADAADSEAARQLVRARARSGCGECGRSCVYASSRPAAAGCEPCDWCTRARARAHNSPSMAALATPCDVCACRAAAGARSDGQRCCPTSRRSWYAFRSRQLRLHAARPPAVGRECVERPRGTCAHHAAAGCPACAAPRRTTMATRRSRQRYANALPRARVHARRSPHLRRRSARAPGAAPGGCCVSGMPAPARARRAHERMPGVRPVPAASRPERTRPSLAPRQARPPAARPRPSPTRQRASRPRRRRAAATAARR